MQLKWFILFLISEPYIGSHEFCNGVLKAQTLSPSVMFIEPHYLHERLFRQQGLFAVPFEVRQAFEYNLSLATDSLRKELQELFPLNNESLVSRDIINFECLMLKVIIPKSMHKSIKQELKLMNISSETLFPGIDGMAKSLGDWE